MKIMGIREYARYRGCSHVAVLKAIESYRLDKSIRIVKGKKKILSQMADLEWDKNTQIKVDENLNVDTSDFDIDKVLESSGINDILTPINIEYL